MSNPIDLEKTNKPIHVYLFDCTSQHGDLDVCKITHIHTQTHAPTRLHIRITCVDFFNTITFHIKMHLPFIILTSDIDSLIKHSKWQHSKH